MSSGRPGTSIDPGPAVAESCDERPSVNASMTARSPSHADGGDAASRPMSRRSRRRPSMVSARRTVRVRRVRGSGADTPHGIASSESRADMRSLPPWGTRTSDAGSRQAGRVLGGGEGSTTTGSLVTLQARGGDTPSAGPERLRRSESRTIRSAMAMSMDAISTSQAQSSQSSARRSRNPAPNHSCDIAAPSPWATESRQGGGRTASTRASADGGRSSRALSVGSARPPCGEDRYGLTGTD